jgi:hypothetical protein
MLGTVGNVSCFADKAKKHVDLILDPYFAIDVPDVGLYRAGTDVQMPGNVACPDALANKLGDLLLARGQLIALAQVKPLPVVKKH